MSIATDKARIEGAKVAIAAAIADKGETVPNGTKIDGMAELIASIETGGGSSYDISASVLDKTNPNPTIDPTATVIAPYMFYRYENLAWDSIGNIIFNGCTNLTDIKVPWAEGEVAGAPWGATNATITYNYVSPEV